MKEGSSMFVFSYLELCTCILASVPSLVLRHLRFSPPPPPFPKPHHDPKHLTDCGHFVKSLFDTTTSHSCACSHSLVSQFPYTYNFLANMPPFSSGLRQLRRSRRGNSKAPAERIRRSREEWLGRGQAGQFPEPTHCAWEQKDGGGVEEREWQWELFFEFLGRGLKECLHASMNGISLRIGVGLG